MYGDLAWGQDSCSGFEFCGVDYGFAIGANLRAVIRCSGFKLYGPLLAYQQPAQSPATKELWEFVLSHSEC